MKKIIYFLTVLFITTSVQAQDEDPNMMRIYEVYTYIQQMYMDEVPSKAISEDAVRAMLKELDPHSTYIPADEVEQANERINGNFVGVGIRFNILNDTLLVVNPIPGGPSEKLGIMAGDQILTVNDEEIAGVGLKNSGVRKRLLGEKGSEVDVSILRNGKENIGFTITRDNIPVNSVVSAYMVDDEVGYIKLTNFSRSSADEVDDAIKKLKKQGMKDLIFDLQGNGGGLLYGAKKIADEFLADEKIIVYSEGRKQPINVLKADKKGRFEKGRLVILTNESSASASEILSGAMQDWDRGLIVGRRTFGKGLVQRPIELSDGAQLRLTIARYYTPSGRWIQKPYDDADAYRKDYMTRYEHGEMMHRDSIDLPDSLIHKTLVNGRDVYGGGGIMPDIFVPLDTSEYSDYYKELSRSGVINKFSLEYANENRDELTDTYKDATAFKDEFEVDKAFMDEFFAYTSKEHEDIEFSEEDYKLSQDLLHLRLKAMVAQNIWDYQAFYQIFNRKNEIFMEAYNALKNGRYEKMNLNIK